METFWKSGQRSVLRGVVNEKVWSAMAVIVVKDSQEETVLLLLPGAQCMFPEGLFLRKQGDYSLGSRWEEAKRQTWTLQETHWKTNRFLMVLEPEKYYAIFHIWEHAQDHFHGYYVNFQLPYRRSHCGFDTLDLDLDIVVTPQFHWKWKDEDHYHAGVQEQGIRPEWVSGIESSQPEVFDRIHHQSYPFDASWISWRPNSTWTPPQLPEQWSIY